VGSVSTRLLSHQKTRPTDSPSQCREGQGFVLVYSIASRATFDRLEVFRQNMVRVKRSHPVFVLVGNKCDKTYEREVSREEGAALARHFGCEFLETSAKTAANVDRLFTDLVRTLRYQKEIQENGGPLPAQGSGSGLHGAPGNRPKKQQRSKCVIV
jgi:GTPase SAR1 family protein